MLSPRFGSDRFGKIRLGSDRFGWVQTLPANRLELVARFVGFDGKEAGRFLAVGVLLLHHITQAQMYSVGARHHIFAGVAVIRCCCHILTN